MADLDDLLGDSAKKQTVDIDDLLGGPSPQPTAAAFVDDDLLFGPAKPSTTSAPSAPSPAPPANQTKGQPKKQQGTIGIPIVANLPAGLHPFQSDVTYFVRFVSLLDQEGRRTRRVIAVTNSQIYVLTPDVHSERTIPITSVIGVVMQNLCVSRRMGTAKDWEQHVLIQVEGDGDIFFALTRDEANGNTAQTLDIVQVLSALCMSFGEALPVSTLREDESIQEMVKWKQGDDRTRKQLAEVLAFRTELSNELGRLSKSSAQLEYTISALKSSSAGQAVTDIARDIAELEKAVAHFTAENEAATKNKAAEEELHAQLENELGQEQRKREAAVKDTMEAAAQEHLMRQVVEYELMKAAHRRDMDKIAALTSFNDRRLQGRRQQTYTAGQIPLRIDDLEEELEFLREKLIERGEVHSLTVKALAEAKRRVQLGRDIVKQLEDEIAAIKTFKIEDELPAQLTGDSHPHTSELVRVEVQKVSDKPPTVQPPVSQPPKPVAAPPQAKAPITLDSDDDI